MKVVGVTVGGGVGVVVDDCGSGSSSSGDSGGSSCSVLDFRGDSCGADTGCTRSVDSVCGILQHIVCR